MIFRFSLIFLALISIMLSSCSKDSQYNNTKTSNDTNTTQPTTVQAPNISSSANILNGNFNTPISTWIPVNSSPDTVDSWSISPAILCGLNFDTTTGKISGTPNCADEMFFEIQATNAGGVSSKTVVLRVSKATQTIDANIDRVVGISNTTFMQKILTNGAGSGAISYKISDDTIATINPSTSLVTFIQAGVVTITATKASDSNYLETTDSYMLTIFDDEKPTLSMVSISSNNALNPNSFAKELDEIKIEFDSTEPLNISTINATISGRMANISDRGDSDETTFDATIVMTESDIEGNITFNITGFEDMQGNIGDTVSSTTNGSSIIYDKTAPIITTSNNITIDENIKLITTIVAHDNIALSNTPYSLDSTSYDNQFVSIDQVSSELEFKTKANYEEPKDENKDNIYEIFFITTDKAGNETNTTVRATIANIVEPLISKWSVLAGDTITVTASTNHSIDYDILWGDGSSDMGVTTRNHTHTYTNTGTYTVTINRKFPGFKFNNDSSKDKIVSLEQWGDIALKNMSTAFYGCSNLQINATDSPNLKTVASMYRAFKGAISFNADINHWDISKITDMREVFYGATNFNSDLNNWNMLNVLNTSGMFYGATSFNGKIDKWNTANITTMNRMFNGATSFNQDISSWNVSQVTNMANMLKDATSFDQNLASWNISSVTNINNFLRGASMSTQNYSDTLVGWSSLSLQIGENFHGGSSKYNTSGQTARDNIINNFGWNINDGGLE